MNVTLFNIIIALIPIVGMVITGFIIPLLVSKLGADKLVKIVKWVAFAVKAAENIYKQSGQGEIKKEYVINFIDHLFNKKKVVITKEQISVIIESIVYEMNKDKVI